MRREMTMTRDVKMTRDLTIRCGAALAIAAVALTATSCDATSGITPDKPAASIPALPGAPTSATTKSTQASQKSTNQIDFTKLLLEGRDISATSDTFSGPAPTANPNGQPGAEVLLVNQQQTKAVNILLVGLGSPDAAPSALAEAQNNLANAVTVGQSQPAPVGNGGTVVTGTSPDGAKSVTVLLFTEGPVLARIEFDGVPGDPAPSTLVTNVGQKQDIALRVGLAVAAGK